MASVVPEKSGKVLRIVTVKAGQTYVLPKGATVESMTSDGGATVTSECPLPPMGQYVCGYFYFLVDKDSHNSHSMNEQDTKMVHLKVGDKIYPIDLLIVTGEDSSSRPQKKADLNAKISDKGIFSFTAVTHDQSPTKRQGVWLYFKVPEALRDTVEMEVDNRGSIQYYRPVDVECGTLPFGVNRETLPLFGN